MREAWHDASRARAELMSGESVLNLVRIFRKLSPVYGIAVHFHSKGDTLLCETKCTVYSARGPLNRITRV